MPCTPDTRGSMGALSALLVEASNTSGDPCVPATFDDNSEIYVILQENLRYTDELIGNKGLTGTIDRTKAYSRHGARVVAGQITLQVGTFDLDGWLPRIMGNPASGDTFAMDDEFNLVPFDIMVKRDLGTAIYRHCGVRAAVFNCQASGGEGQILTLTLDIVGFEEHTSTYPSPAPAVSTNNRAYWLIGDAELSLTPSGGSSGEYFFDSFSLRIDNGLTPLIRNFLHPTALQSRGREVTLRASTPYTSASHTSLYINEFRGGGSISFTDKDSTGEPQTASSTTFTLNDLVSIRRTPSITGPGEIPLFIDMVAHRSGSTAPLSVTNVYVSEP